MDQRNTSRPYAVVTCGCEPENANATPEIATAVTGGAVSGVAFVFSGGRKRKCNDGRPEGENFLGVIVPVFGQIGGKLVVSDVLRPILAHVRSKYSNTQHRIRNLEPQTDARNKFCGALDLNSKPAKTKRSRQIICQGFWGRLGGYAAAHVGSMRATVFRSVHVCSMLGPCKSVL